MNRIMLDLETMGTGPNAAIIAIGAVFFAPETQELGAEFYRVVDLESSMQCGGVCDASTILWWMQQDDAARSAFARKGNSLPFVLGEFAHWVSRGLDARNTEVWGNGATFDNVILSQAYKNCELPRPWTYKGDRCYRTMREVFPHIEHKPYGTYHNALDDAKGQAIHLMEIFREAEL